MVRRWRLIGHFPILYNPLFKFRNNAQLAAWHLLGLIEGLIEQGSLWGGRAILAN
jgi:hypothetical protein